jgi:hypothetical protein
MSKKQHTAGPVPPANRPKGPANSDEAEPNENVPDGTGFNEQDPKRRLGDYTGAGEHSIQEPGGKNGADRTTKSE